MTPEILREHIRKCKQATDKPFGVNFPLLFFPQAETVVNVLMEEGVKIVFTSAGNPAKWTSFFKSKGMTVVHVIANVKFAKKCQEAGVDAVVAEGFEAGGHNGIEETTTMVLTPMVCNAVKIPVIAAGGIGTGRGMLAAFALGAEGVQIGSRFVTTEESSAHINFKKRILETTDGDTMLSAKRLGPVRLIKNKFYYEMEKLEQEGASTEKMLEFMGTDRAKHGMFEGNLEEGKLEIGQISGMIKEIKPARAIVEEIMEEFYKAQKELGGICL
jgi:enoyl-[acyl-carrier protein] reductase II